jgi:phosphohistidine phosphatase SixA
MSGPAAQRFIVKPVLNARVVRWTAVLALVALAGCGGGSSSTRPGPAELVEELRTGGYVLYFRHALTDHSQEDAPNVDPRDCRNQRNLTVEGREQARMIGRAIRELELPVGRIATSKFCRTRQTALLAFGRAEASEILTRLPPEQLPSAHRARVRELRRLTAARPRAGTNTVLVGHITSLTAATGVHIEEGDIVVFEPLGEERFRLAGVLPAAVWPQLLERVDSTAARASRSNGFSRYG